MTKIQLNFFGNCNCRYVTCTPHGIRCRNEVMTEKADFFLRDRIFSRALSPSLNAPMSGACTGRGCVCGRAPVLPRRRLWVLRPTHAAFTHAAGGRQGSYTGTALNAGRWRGCTMSDNCTGLHFKTWIGRIHSLVTGPHARPRKVSSDPGMSPRHPRAEKLRHGT